MKQNKKSLVRYQYDLSTKKVKAWDVTGQFQTKHDIYLSIQEIMDIAQRCQSARAFVEKLDEMQS